MVKQKKSREPAVNKMPGGVGSPAGVASGAQGMAAEALSVRQLLLTGLMAVLFFLAVCLSSVATVKGMAMLLLIVGVATVFFGMGVLRDHVGPLLGLVAAWVLLDGISTLYAISGKFALYEFLKVIISFCLLLIMLALARGRGWQPGRRLAMVLSMAAALMALVSIDMISTRWVSGAV